MTVEPRLIAISYLRSRYLDKRFYLYGITIEEYISANIDAAVRNLQNADNEAGREIKRYAEGGSQWNMK